LDNFNCSKCGACCRNLDKSIYFKQYHSGDGICIYLDLNTNLCKIYDNRPLICNVDKSYYMHFINYMTKIDYYNKNNIICELLRDIELSKLIHE
jgi:Fe-S-cluster containining protein